MTQDSNGEPHGDRSRGRRAASPDADFIDLGGTEVDPPRVDRSLSTRADLERAESDGSDGFAGAAANHSRGGRPIGAPDAEGRFTGPSLTFGRLLVEGIAPPLPPAPTDRPRRARIDPASWLLLGSGVVALLAALVVLLAPRL
jgi:hypothetical protein